MANRPRKPLVFHCGKCMSTLTASRSKAGKRLRCPKCFHEVVVPEESALAEQEIRHQQAYEMNESWAPGQEGEQHFVVLCPICFARIDGTPQLVGQTVTCPDCDTPVPIVPPAEPLRTKAPKRENVVYEGTDEYALEEPTAEGQPYTPRRRSEAPEVPVVCPLCHTRLYARLDEVGTTKICPDCETVIEVLPPAKPVEPTAAKQRSFEGSVDYGVAKQGDAAAPREPLIPVVCGVCHTRMYAPESQIGQSIACPDCETLTVVPKARPELPPLEMIGPDDPGYEPGQAITTPEPRIGVDYRTVGRPGEQHFETDAAALGGTTRRKLPTAPLLSGVFTFLASGELWIRYSLLAIAGFCVGIFPPMLVGAYQAGGYSVILAMLLSALTAGAGAIWICAAACHCQTIVEDSAEGNDFVENWSEENLSVRLLDGLPLIVGLGLGFAPGTILTQLLPMDAILGEQFGYWAEAMIILVGFWLTAPLFVLSIFAGGSMSSLISVDVVTSPLRLPVSWFLFFAETLLLVGGTAFLCGVCLPAAGLTVTSLFLGPVLLSALTLYCRLLGRIGWCVVESLR